MAHKRMPSDYAVIMHRKAKELGVDLLEGLPVSLDELESSDWVRTDYYAMILDRFCDLHTEPDWGFRLGQLFSMANHGHLGFGAMFAPTIRDGLIFLCRYIPVRTSYTLCTVERRGGSLHLVFTFDEVALANVQVHSETFCMIFQSYLESAGATAVPTTWRFPYSRPRHHEVYDRWVMGGYSFGASRLRLEVPDDVCSTPSAFRNDAGFRSATSQCEAILAEHSTENLIDKIGNILATRISRRAGETVPVTSIPGIEEMAGHLHVSRRHLSRQLADAGVTFRSLKDTHVKSHLDNLLLDSHLPIEEIADRLDYASPASLTRACKRLFGDTPRNLRARLR